MGHAAGVPTRTDPDVEETTGAGGLNEQEVEDTLQRTVDEGRRRMNRGWLPLLSTGMVGGIDVGTGILAMLVVETRTGDKLSPR